MKTKSLILAGALCLSHTPQAMAGEWNISLGGFYTTSNTTMDVTSPLGDRDFGLNFEKDLKLSEDKWLPYANLNYQFNNKHSIYFDWKRLHRNATQERITKPFETDLGGDTTYIIQAGARIKTTLNIDIATLGYGYSFYQDEKWDLAATLGMHIMWIEIGLNGEMGACVNNTCTGAVPILPNTEAFKDTTAPLPDVGLKGRYLITPNWALTGQAQYFYLSLDDLDGSLIDLNGGVEYLFNEDFSASAKYAYYDVDAKFKGNISDLKLKFNYHGPMFQLHYRF
ncbi:outer membrane protein [Motilimonas eburnea]|uniref:outer membrane protein n=1 Tax=Motilimonas eburnea TaxID=1737488 RepID=UPI001E3994B1|nr:DUF481 domain-containing protein [Motilimonas eburnea]MCE2571073.1 DUF481 domain-containing protein [Motilimonas eburnea]